MHFQMYEILTFSKIGLGMNSGYRVQIYGLYCITNDHHCLPALGAPAFEKWTEG